MKARLTVSVVANIMSTHTLILDEGNEDHYLREPFSFDELNTTIKDMKVNNASGIDDLRTHNSKYFGDTTLQRLLN